LISTADAKHFANIDDTGDAAYDSANDSLIDSLVIAAYKQFEQYTGKRLIHTTFTATLDYTPCEYQVWLRDLPIVSVDKVYAINTDATENTTTDFEIDLPNGIVISEDWPTGSKQIGSFKIDYTAGLFANVASVTDDVITCLKQMVAHWFEHRESVTAESMNAVPMHAMLIMNNYKTRRV
jgi:uncharacterized phiE125 gp8 family phage protein